jgi:hypothetical protein
MTKRIREEVFKHRPSIKKWEKVVVSLPVVLSLSWIFYIKYSEYAFRGYEMASPANSTPLIFALILFVIGYMIFLFLMFSDNLHDFIKRRLRQ